MAFISRYSIVFFFVLFFVIAIIKFMNVYRETEGKSAITFKSIKEKIKKKIKASEADENLTEDGDISITPEYLTEEEKLIAEIKEKHNEFKEHMGTAESTSQETKHYRIKK